MLIGADIGPNQECQVEGEVVVFQCSFNPEPGIVSLLEWNGYGFDCPSNDTIVNNVISLEVHDRCPLPRDDIGLCGPYSANLMCSSEGTEVVSLLTFTASRTMNGGSVNCVYMGTQRIYPLQVGGKYNGSIVM